MPRHKNMDWNLPEGTPKPNGGGHTHTWESIRAALLMDIRDELQDIAGSLRVLRCRNFLRIPAKLDRIGLNTERKKRSGTGVK